MTFDDGCMSFNIFEVFNILMMKWNTKFFGSVKFIYYFLLIQILCNDLSLSVINAVPDALVEQCCTFKMYVTSIVYVSNFFNYHLCTIKALFYFKDLDFICLFTKLFVSFLILFHIKFEVKILDKVR